MRQHPETTNAADSKSVKKSARREQRRLEDYLAAVRKVMSTPEGRRVFGDRENGLLVRYGLYRTTFAVDNAIYFNSGRHSCALELLALLESAAPEFFLQMENEGRVIEKRADVEAEAAAIEAAGRAETDDE